MHVDSPGTILIFHIGEELMRAFFVPLELLEERAVIICTPGDRVSQMTV